jgi:hypothetical protein
MSSLFNSARREPWLWLGSSVALAMLWTNLAWLFSPWVDTETSTGPPNSLAESIVFRLANWRLAPSVFQGLRLLYYVGLPSAALFWGRDAVVSRFLGLQRLALPLEAGSSLTLSANWSDWVHDLGWTAVLGLSSSALLLLAALVHRQALPGAHEHRRSNRPSVWKAAREAVYHEMHWAFYRNAPALTLRLYWGTWTGLALVAFEAAVNPAWRRGFREPGRAWSQLSRGALAVLSSLLFLRAQNLWLAVLLHWVISWTLEAVYPAPSALPAEAVSPRE